MIYDLLILGGGPAGYIAAERAGEHGMTVALVEASELGGICLNQGCIPSKTLLNSAKIYYAATHGEAYGVQVTGASFDLSAANRRKQDVMATLRKGVAGLMKKYKVEVIRGRGRLVSGREIDVDGAIHQAHNILIATGSSPMRPPIPGIDLPRVVDSTGLLNQESLPERFTVIGGGVIGCEFACFFASVGVPVTVIEMLDEICPAVDPVIAKALRTALAAKGVDFKLGAKVTGITETSVEIETAAGAEEIPRDLVLVATGRAPNVGDIGLEAAGVAHGPKGIDIDDRCATNVPGVYAAGDVTGRTWLAHAGSRMGEVVVHNLQGRPDRVRFDTIAGVIYTSPEVATVGLTEADAAARGIPVKTGRMPLTANGRYLAEHDGERGLVKAVVHADTGTLLGVHMIGGACSEMIYGAAAMIEAEWRVREIEDLVFPHPTTSEAIRDTLLQTT